jgi:hypothetical protein
MDEIHWCSNVSLFVNCPENVFLVGSVPELRNWSPDNAIPLSSTDYPTWSGKYSGSGLRVFLAGFVDEILAHSDRHVASRHDYRLQIYQEER